MSAQHDIDDWPDRVEARLAALGTSPRRAFVVAETASTQDTARRHGPSVGDVIVAGRQYDGRGRLGRAWADTGGEGVAMSVVVEAAPPERLAIRAAVATAMACERVLRETETAPPGIKWPNDIVADGRKLAGILVEQDASVAIIGIGVNVAQRGWPLALAHRATSLAELGADVRRIEVIEALLDGLHEAFALTDTELCAAYAKRDVLVGREATVRCRGETVTGRVERVDPMRGLVLRANGEPVFLAAAHTTILDVVS